MTFDMQDFVRTNKVVFIWAVFLGLTWFILDQGLFGLIFVTFILTFLFHRLIALLRRRTGLPRRALTLLVYLVFVAILSVVLSLVIPKLGSEARIFATQLPQTQDKIHAWIGELAGNYPSFAPTLMSVKKFLSLESLTGIDSDTLVNVAVKTINEVTRFVSFLLLGIFFSLLILFDFPNLKAKFQALGQSRIQGFYEVVADSLYHFGLYVGEGFKAQFFISCCNTALTALGLWILGITPIVLLCAIVFVCGLIPVMGMVLSTIPIMLLAFNGGGFERMLWAVLMVTVVHLFETYVLNPRIFSAVFKINPVMTLFILFIALRFGGLWGMILGVPVSVFIYRYLIMRPRYAGGEDGVPPLPGGG